MDVRTLPHVLGSGIKRLGIIAALSLCAASVARADVIVTFQLNNVSFASGATATGTFTLDETTKQTTAVDIFYKGAINFHFTDPSATSDCVEALGMAVVGFCAANIAQNPALIFDFSSVLGTGADTIVGGSFVNDSPTVFDMGATGSISPASSVPEPEVIALFGLGIVAAGLARPKRSH